MGRTMNIYEPVKARAVNPKVRLRLSPADIELMAQAIWARFDDRKVDTAGSMELGAGGVPA